MPFILSDKGNYDFDIKVGCCGFVCFVNNMIECECLRCIFFFLELKKKRKTHSISMNSLLIKFYKNYVIIQIQHYPKPFYIKHYNIIRASHR